MSSAPHQAFIWNGIAVEAAGRRRPRTAEPAPPAGGASGRRRFARRCAVLEGLHTSRINAADTFTRIYTAPGGLTATGGTNAG